VATNLLAAMLNIKKYNDNDLKRIVAISNPEQPRVNKEGTPFDAFIKDSFCNSFSIKDPPKKMEIYLKEFSYLGSQNYPPDIMIRGGDAIEVKKVKNFGGISIALNSSYPKHKLKANGPMVTEELKTCENWKEKDIVYCVGNVFSNKVKIITFVYGDCYAADAEIYEKVKKPLIDGIKSLKLNLSKTKELARLNKIDPLKITDLRVRGMFQIASPIRFFSQFFQPDIRNELSVYAIMRKEKFDSFSSEDRQKAKKEMGIKDIKIMDPNSPSKLIDAKLISFSF